MSYFVGIYDWSLYSLPSALATSNIEGDTHSNDPASADYNSSAPSWIGETFTYNGGSPTLLEIDDDDPDFQDAYVETGGAQTLAQDVTINGTTYLAGSVVENEFSMVDASGSGIWVVRIDGNNVGFTYAKGSEPSPGDTFVGATGRDGDSEDSGDGQSSAASYQAIVCFTAGARILTPGGARPVETLQIGDPVTTIDNGAQAIRWISRRRVDFSDGAENAKPVEIKAGALGSGCPERRLVVSPQHRFVCRERDARRESAVFVPARALTALPNIRVMKGKKSVEYIHFALDRHEVIVAENLVTESCYLGPVVLQGIAPAERPSMSVLFPGLEFDTGRGYGPTARPVLKVNAARRLLRSGQLALCAGAALVTGHTGAMPAGPSVRGIHQRRPVPGPTGSARSGQSLMS